MKAYTKPRLVECISHLVGTVRLVFFLSLLVLTTLSAHSAPGHAADQSRRASLQNQIDYLSEHIRSYDKFRLDDPSSVVLLTVGEGLTGVRFAVLSTEEFLGKMAASRIFERSTETLQQQIKESLRSSKTTKHLMRQEVATLRRERDRLIYELEQLDQQAAQRTTTGESETSWAGTWSVTSTHVNGPKETKGKSFNSKVRVELTDSGCKATFSGSKIKKCSVFGNKLELTGTHPSGGAMTWTLVRDGHKLVESKSKIDGTINGVAADGTYTGSKN